VLSRQAGANEIRTIMTQAGFIPVNPTSAGLLECSQGTAVGQIFSGRARRWEYISNSSQSVSSGEYTHTHTDTYTHIHIRIYRLKKTAQ
jgi:hypothetical protein